MAHYIELYVFVCIDVFVEIQKWIKITVDN
jgi:hypothetical protein